jgi:hypothetical protein
VPGARAEGVQGWQLEAMGSLVDPGKAIRLYNNGSEYFNGQHRAQALLDTGVRETLIVR